MKSSPVRLGRPIAPLLQLNEVQIRHRDSIQASIDDGTLTMEESVCFCGETRGLSLLASDSWGFRIPTVMCRRCYTLRSRYFFDEHSMVRFYSEGYYHAHMFTSQSSQAGLGMDESEYRFEEQQKGERLYEWLSRNVDISQVRSVLDVGCGAGGVLRAFHDRGMKICGCDYVARYIGAARRDLPSADLRVGSFEQFAPATFDLVILADVVEHLRDPLLFLKQLRCLVHDTSLLCIVVPGLFGISNHRFHCSFRFFAKIEHTWCHTLQSLSYLMQSAGYQLRTGNQGTMAVYSPLGTKSTPVTPPGMGYAVFTLLFLASLPIRRFLKIDNYIYSAARRLRRYRAPRAQSTS